MTDTKRTPPAIEAGYEHAEAFTHMRYGTKDGSVIFPIWNSRDGVTPFGCLHPIIEGLELTHLPSWQLDHFDPLYLPQVGEYVWIDLDPEKALQIAMERVEGWWEHPKYPMSQAFDSKLDAAQVLLDDMLYTTMLDGTKVEAHAPDLVQVTPLLLDRLAAARERRFESRADL